MNIFYKLIYIFIYNLKKKKKIEYPVFIKVLIHIYSIYIDNIHTKLDLIEYCVKNKINIISSTGAGAKWYVLQFY